MSKKEKEVVDFLKELAEEEPDKDKKIDKEIKPRKDKKVQKPIGITILTILFIFSGLINLIFSIVYLIQFQNGYTYLTSNPRLYLFSLIYSLIISIIVLIIGYGLYKGYKKGYSWAWRGAIIIMVLALLGNLSYGNFFPAILNIIIIVYLTRRHVRAFFRTEGLPPSIP